ncbi:hypothetical protein RQP46_010153 [Phenoliferia psychrophenolica]
MRRVSGIAFQYSKRSFLGEPQCSTTPPKSCVQWTAAFGHPPIHTTGNSAANRDLQMRSSLFGLAALFALARADGTDANAAKSYAVVMAASVTSISTDTYIISNVENGKNIYFERDTQVGAFLGDDTSGMILQKVTYDDPNLGSVTGYIIEGPTSSTQKCLAAQWNFDTTYRSMQKRARDEYAVPYECALGSDGNGNIDTGTAKEVWIINEVDCAGSSSSATTSSAAAGATASVGVSVSLDVKLDAVEATDSTTTTTAASSTSSSTATCPKEGWWLYRHQEYIEKYNHPECKSVLAAYEATLSRKMVRRSRHAEQARHMRAKRASSCYVIHPVDHLIDMTTLSLSGTSTTGFAGAGAIEIAYADDASLPIST